jgi:CHAT domain-containing protein
MNLGLNADLVTLSACASGLNVPLPGDELVGLTSALLYAGASSVLVTLWDVDAVAARGLMTNFYTKMQGTAAPPLDKAAALREAMREAQKQSHPFYWAPFILVGDWR